MIQNPPLGLRADLIPLDDFGFSLASDGGTFPRDKKLAEAIAIDVSYDRFSETPRCLRKQMPQ